MAQLPPDILGILNQTDTTVNGLLADPNINSQEKNKVQERRLELQKQVEEYLNNRDRDMENFKKRLEGMLKNINDDINRMRR